MDEKRSHYRGQERSDRVGLGNPHGSGEHTHRKHSQSAVGPGDRVLAAVDFAFIVAHVPGTTEPHRDKQQPDDKNRQSAADRCSEIRK